MALSLPNNPDLERFRRDARRLQRAVRAGDTRALALARRHQPDGVPEPAAFTLAAAQLTVARSYGFPSWPRLRAYLRTAAVLRRDPTQGLDTEDTATRFLALACLTYSDVDEPSRWAEAVRLLRAEPSLPAADPYVAAAVGDPDALAAHLDADPGLARREGGPWRWTALLYLSYARVPQRDPLATARLLLDAGADPNAGYLWLGLPTPFTVLTGCFGEGEAGPGRLPRHPMGLELAELLIGRGADPNDAQTLYNRMFGRDDSHLRLLLAHGLGRGTGGGWHRRLGEVLESPTQMVQRQIDWARDHGLTDRLELFARYGFTAGTPAEDRSPWIRAGGPRPHDLVGTPAAVARAVADGLDLDVLVDGRTLLHQAAWAGDEAMVVALLSAGADPDVVDATHGTTPLGWAEWAHSDATAAILQPVTGVKGGARDTGEPVG